LNINKEASHFRDPASWRQLEW